MGAKIRVLLIDDEPLVRDELGGLLEDEGYEVLTAGDGEEGLRQFRTESPEMVITDMRMPRRDGLSVAMSIREEAPMVPVTVITGHGTEAMAIQALRAGVTDFIKKPVRVDDLIAALARMRAALRVTQAEPAALPSSVVLLERGWTYVLSNELEAIPIFVDVLLRQCTAGMDRQAITELSLALRELILNAVEHGNLALSYQEKTRALETGTLERVLAQRLAQAPYRDRRVTVVTTRQDEQLLFQVADEGAGFDWRALPDPTNVEYLLADHGRGVLLAQMSVDELRYNERGNQVTLIKRLAPSS